MTDEELFDELIEYLAAQGRVVDDRAAQVVTIHGFKEVEIDSDTPFHLHVTPRSLGEHLRADATGPSTVWPDVDPLTEQWRLFTVHIQEAVETARPGETELVLAPTGVASRAP